MSGAAAASAAAPAITDEDVRLYLVQTVDAYKEACTKGFSEHKFEPITTGLTIGNHIMTQIVNRCTASTQPGQVTTMNNADMFTMVSVFCEDLRCGVNLVGSCTIS